MTELYIKLCNTFFFFAFWIANIQKKKTRQNDIFPICLNKKREICNVPVICVLLADLDFD